MISPLRIRAQYIMVKALFFGSAMTFFAFSGIPTISQVFRFTLIPAELLCSVIWPAESAIVPGSSTALISLNVGVYFTVYFAYRWFVAGTRGNHIFEQIVARPGGSDQPLHITGSLFVTYRYPGWTNFMSMIGIVVGFVCLTYAALFLRNTERFGPLGVFCFIGCFFLIVRIVRTLSRCNEVVNFSIDGISDKGLFNSKFIRWADIDYVLEYKSPLEGEALLVNSKQGNRIIISSGIGRNFAQIREHLKETLCPH